MPHFFTFFFGYGSAKIVEIDQDLPKSQSIQTDNNCDIVYKNVTRFFDGGISRVPSFRPFSPLSCISFLFFSLKYS